MKATKTHGLLMASIGLLLPTGAQATSVIALPASPITTWSPMADTATIPPLKHGGSGSVSTFSAFTPPVVIGNGTGTSPTQIAYKGQMTVAGPVTTANDEGIWSNVDPLTAIPTGLTSWMIVQEGDLAGGVPIGNATNMNVQALQTTMYGGTLFTTNSSANPLLNLSVYEGGSPLPNGLAGTSVAGFTDGGRAVTNGDRIAAWAQSGLLTGTKFWDVSFVSSFPHGLTVGSILWPPPTSSPKVQCSPVISEYGGVAHRARAATGPGFTRDYIGADPISPSRLFPASTIVVRRNALAKPTERFGIFHPNLMAITGGPNINPTVAWQMSNMFTNAGSPATLGTVIPNSNSLWCWTFGVAGYQEIARVGDVLTDFTTSVTIKSFYALHLTEDRSVWRDSDVFYGVQLSTPGKYAIYHRHITFPGTLSPPQLIATDHPSGPVGLHVPAIFPAGTPYPITTLFPWFSVDPRGNVLMKATINGAPAGHRQCLIAARTATTHALEMRAQSDPTVFIPTLALGPRAIANFFITNPEQGPLGRGQAIGRAGVGTVIRFTGPVASGVYIGQ